MEANVSGSSDEHNLQAPAAVLEQSELQKAVASLSVLCTEPPELSEQFMLWFYSAEVEVVQTVWEEGGIEAVLDHWGETRRTSIPQQYTTDTVSGLDAADRQSTHFLQILKFSRPTTHDEAQSSYYRAAQFLISDALEAALLAELSNSGLIAAVLPAVDPITNVTVAHAEIVGLGAGVQWYGVDNWYGDGCVFQLSLELDSVAGQAIFVACTVDESGRTHSKIFSPELFETGYEGHGQRRVSLTPAQMKIMTEIIVSLRDSQPVVSTESYIGAWIK